MKNFLGRLLFPDLPPWQREVQVKVILWAAAVLLLALIVAGIVFFIRLKK